MVIRDFILSRFIGVVSFVLFFSSPSHATEQVWDKLIVDGDTFEVSGFPLESYLDTKGNRKMGSLDLTEENYCSNLHRGYVATWLLNKDSLYLIGLYDDCNSASLDDFMLEEFGQDTVWARWYSGNFFFHQGDLLYDGPLFSLDPINYVTESLCNLMFRRGTIFSSFTQNFIEYDSLLLYPSIDSLSSLLKQYYIECIAQYKPNLTLSDFPQIYAVFFDSTRHVSRSSVILESKSKNAKEVEKILTNCTEELADSWPVLMKVNNPYYQIPQISIEFIPYQ